MNDRTEDSWTSQHHCPCSTEETFLQSSINSKAHASEWLGNQDSLCTCVLYDILLDDGS